MTAFLQRLFADYSMLGVLLALCAGLSAATLAEQYPAGASGGTSLARDIVAQTQPGDTVLIVIRPIKEDREFAEALQAALAVNQRAVVGMVTGGPADAGKALTDLAQARAKLAVIAGNQATAAWEILHRDHGVGNPRVVSPASYYWPTFLKADNLLNIANQISVIALIAIGMTMVIITGGIDLSVGSLMALAAVTATKLIRDQAGAYDASAEAMVLCCLAAIAFTAAVGLASGLVITRFALPPFIVTLAVMLIARGRSGIISQNKSIFEVPPSFNWLGGGATLGPIPNAVILTGFLYVIAHVIMTHTVWGRYIYAVGSNKKAARFSGVPVERTIISVYIVSGALAGLGGVVLASQLSSGAPTYGQEVELYVIAAVVVGGTSITGGEGKIFGTLIGALIIAVVRNGMNLLGIESDPQREVLGWVILAAVLLDQLKKQGCGRLGSWLARLLRLRGRS